MKADCDLSEPDPHGYGAPESGLNQSSLFHETLKSEFSGNDTLEDVNVYIPMEYDQRVIIKFLFNEQCDTNQIM
jgi:hypothetical protein